ncbi:MAG: hypothetical protein ACJATA_000794 [Sphingobacteriales bacterium]|jgi:hypothetical protein
MGFLRFFLPVLIFALCANKIYGQEKVSGIIKDGETKEPLAFVNLIFNNNPKQGTSSNIDGQFSFFSNEILQSITLKYVGYKTKEIYIQSGESEFEIELDRALINLDEVVVVAGVNPANRIIRKVIANKDSHNPENLKSFSYSSYNKTIFDFKFNGPASADSSLEKINKNLKGGHMMVMESATERRFLGPDLSQEVILGSKVSGFTNPTFTTLATDFQPFSFYEENLKILDQNYLNPIANGSLRKYDFRIEDTLFFGVDTTYILSFKPKKGKNFDGLIGELYISTNGYAIKNVLAQPAEIGFIDLKFQQEYSFIDNSYWFPSQLNFEISAKNYPSKAIGFSGNGKSYITNVVINPSFTRNDFSAISLKSNEDATSRDSIFWDNTRAMKLTSKEEITYEVMDSIGKAGNFDLLLKVGEKFAESKIPLGWLDLDLPNTLMINKVENYRLGLGLFTNEKISKMATLGGFAGYGLKDKTWKYGASAEFAPEGDSEFILKGEYFNSLFEVGRSNLDLFGGSTYGFRNFLAARMERVKQFKLISGVRFLKYFKVKASISQSEITPKYLEFSIFAPPSANFNYSNLESNVTLRYAYGEKLVESFGQKVSMSTKSPIFLMSWSKGIANDLGDWSYNKFEGSIDYKLYFKLIGETKLKIVAGYSDSPLPYGFLFTGEGSFDEQFSVVIEDYFQTLRPYEFLSDRYISLFISHNFGPLLFKTRNFSPQIVVSQNSSWGELAPYNAQFGVDYLTKEKGFFESGIQFQNLIKFNYLNLAYLGLGTGIFYRWGPYSHENYQDNISVKVTFNITSK